LEEPVQLRVRSELCYRFISDCELCTLPTGFLETTNTFWHRTTLRWAKDKL